MIAYYCTILASTATKWNMATAERFDCYIFRGEAFHHLPPLLVAKSFTLCKVDSNFNVRYIRPPAGKVIPACIIYNCIIYAWLNSDLLNLSSHRSSSDLGSTTTAPVPHCGLRGEWQLGQGSVLQGATVLYEPAGTQWYRFTCTRATLYTVVTVVCKMHIFYHMFNFCMYR